jgi:GNAT superfamily N-acetyltransferase
MRSLIREFQPGDAAGVAAVIRELGEGPVTPQGMIHRVDSMPVRAEARFLVADDGGDIVGWGEARRRWSGDPGIAKLRVVVREDARGQGIGSALWAEAERHLLGLGVRKLATWVDETPEAVAFVTERGFAPQRRTIISVLQPQLLEIEQRDDVSLLPLQDALAREQELFDLYRTTEEDIPSDDEPGRYALEEWRSETLEDPELDHEGSFVVEHGGRLVSLSFLLVDRGRRQAANEMTGTLPELRGRGLATLAKQAAIRWAAANGINEIFTSNHEENAAMLAVNRRLGYRPVKFMWDYEREAETPSGQAPGGPET